MQAALKIVLEPIFEADFLPCPFGFRPQWSAHDALQVLIDEAWDGRRWVVETDIASCFEEIPHSGLMQAIDEVQEAGTRSAPIIRGKSLTAVNEATLRTVIDTGEWGTFVTDEPIAHGGTGEGPPPLQTVLGALCGCEGVTFKHAADDLGLDYERIEVEAAYTIDIRGRKGDRSVRPHFETIKVVARVYTSASREHLREVVEETEARCPVLNLVKDAGVDITMVWEREPV